MTFSHQFPPPAAHRVHAHRAPWPAILGVVVMLHVVVLLAWSCRRQPAEVDVEPPADGPSTAGVTNAVLPVREAPERFPRNTTMPNVKETVASGSIHMPSFSAGRDLIYIDDPRVWWESDNDGEDDDECDHTIHRQMEAPLRRVIEAVVARKAVLKVQDTFRPTGIHNGRSLHREGRAIDLTCEGLSLEELAKICWQAGFDWVYYEAPRGGGDHIHASVSR